MSNAPQEGLAKLRQADFKIGLVMLGLILFLLWQTRTFPMTGSYGGVESQWYVSPALFPLVLLSILFVCAFYLLSVAIRADGHKQLLHLSGWFGEKSNRVNRDRWYVIGALCVYVYVTIPAMDFYLATVAFLFTLLARFYHPNAQAGRVAIAFNLALVGVVFVIRAIYAEAFYWISLEAVVNETQLMLTDSFTAVGIALLSGFLIRLNGKPPYLFRTAFLVPLFLVVSFSFFLQVPMPVEYGSVIRMLEWVWFDVLSL